MHKSFPFSLSRQNPRCFKIDLHDSFSSREETGECLSPRLSSSETAHDSGLAKEPQTAEEAHQGQDGGRPQEEPEESCCTIA